MKGFPDKFVQWTKSVVNNGKVCIMVNDRLGPYFRTRKGLRQGDLFSPLLFNIAAEVLAVLVKRAQDNGLINGLGADLVEDGVSIIQYAEDTIFMFEDSLDSARNLKFILCIFEQLTGLKINFHKSEISFFGDAFEKQDMYTHIFTCKKGDFPFKYLGIPMHYKKLVNSDWKSSEDKVEKKNSSWIGNLASIGSRLILVEASLSNVPSYMLSFFKMPKGVIKRCDFFRARMLWQEKK